MALSADVLSVQDTSSSSFLIFCTSVIFLHVMTTSSSLGYAGLVLPHHTDPTSPLLHLSDFQATWFVTVSPIAMNLGVFLSIPLSEWLGRKRTFLAANFCSMLGYTAVFFAPNFAVLLTARFFQVCAMGLADISPAVYLAEISTVKARGPVSGCNMTAGVVGTLFYTALCIILPIQFLSLAFVAHNMFVLLLVLLLPESPQWLVRKGREAEAKAALLKLRGSTYQGVDLEVDEIKLCSKIEESRSHESLKQTFTSRQFTVPLATFSVVFLCVGLAGTDTMVFYGPTIFSQVKNCYYTGPTTKTTMFNFLSPDGLGFAPLHSGHPALAWLLSWIRPLQPHNGKVDTCPALFPKLYFPFFQDEPGSSVCHFLLHHVCLPPLHRHHHGLGHPVVREGRHASCFACGSDGGNDFLRARCRSRPLHNAW